jgi:hypothetical protein
MNSTTRRRRRTGEVALGLKQAAKVVEARRRSGMLGAERLLADRQRPLQAQMLRGVLAQRAARRLFSPSEAINPLTIGACHDDNATPNGTPLMAVAPYSR